MNKYRKEIIELIEPFMEKDLDFGCYIKMFDTTIHGQDIEYSRYICVDQHFLYQDNPEWSLFEPEKGSDYIVIGHYDITAVLKYIGDTTYGHIKYDGMNLIEVTKADCEFGTYLGQLQVKPLHLYTEDQEKDLLELLKKLNN